MRDAPTEPPPTDPPTPSSMRGFLVLLLGLALVTTIAFLLLGESWHRWFPRE